MYKGLKLGHFYFACCFLLGWIAIPKQATAQFLYWDYHNILNEERQSGARPDMAMDESGNFHLTYWHKDEDRLIYAFRAEGTTTWSYEYVDQSNSNGFVSAIALDAAGTPHLVFMENDNGIARYRYAFRAGPNNWSIEPIPDSPTRGWGYYGTNSSINVSDRIQHSADILIQANGNPQISFFGGWVAPNAFPDCVQGSQYDLRMHQATKIFGQWFVDDFGEVLDLKESCGENNNNPFPLPRGDRYGEFCNLVQKTNGNMEAYTVSKFNNNVLRFTTQGNDTTWNFGQVDSIFGNLDSTPFFWDWSYRFFTFNGLSATVDPNDQVHLAYGMSLNYGENFCCVPQMAKLIYARIINGDTAYRIALGDSGSYTYRTYTSLATQGTDSVYLVYADLSTFQLKMYESIDSGQTWVQDTIAELIALSQSPVSISNDSLHVLFFDSQKESLILGHRSLSGGDWRMEPVTESQNHGESLDGKVVAVNGDTIGHLAFNDGFLGKLFYSTGSANGGWSYQVEELGQAGGRVDAVSFGLGSGQEPCIAYSGGMEGDLRLASRTGSNWSYEIVDSAANVSFTDLAVSALDTLHIVYYSDNRNCLLHASRHLNQSNWKLDSLPCDSLPAGEWPSLVIDANEVPHVAFYDDGGLQLMYARRNPANFVWETDTVLTGVASPVGKFNSLKLDANGLPKIAFLDEQQTDVLLAEQDLAGDWAVIKVDSGAVTNIGRPTELVLDQFDKVWIAYNYFTNFEKIKLMHRDGAIWREVAVSSQGRIANAFHFEIIGGDLYLLGKKNELQNTGVAMLRSLGGVFVESEAPRLDSEFFTFFNFPNPFTSETTLQLELEVPQTLSIDVYNLHGKHIQNVMSNQKLVAGTHQFEFEGKGLVSGIYLCILDNGNSRLTRKLVVGN